MYKVYVCTWAVLLTRGTRPSYARLPNLEDRSGAATRVGDCSPAQDSDGDTLSNGDEARRGTNCMYHTVTSLHCTRL